MTYNEENWQILFLTLGSLSLLSGLVIPFVYIFAKKSRNHPAIILVMICIIEMISCYHLMLWAIDLDSLVQIIQAPYLLQLWSLGQLSNTHSYDQAFCQMNLTMYFLSLFVMYFYYIVLCIDLIITLKRPFISGKSRMFWYHLGAIVSAIIALQYTEQNITNRCQNAQFQKGIPVLFICYKPVIIVQVLFYFFGTVSIIMAVRTKKRYTATNNELFRAKNEYLNNHILIVSMLFIIWTIPACSNLILVFSKDETLQTRMNQISFGIIISQGIFLGIVRLREKFFRNLLVLIINSFFDKCSFQELEYIQQIVNECQGNSDSWNFSLAALANQAQSQELVSHILQGVILITQHRTRVASSWGSNSQFFPTIDIVKKWCHEDKIKIFKANDGTKLFDLFQSSLVDNTTEPQQQEFSLDNRQEEHPTRPQSNRFEFQSIKVTEYAPRVFQVIRNHDGLQNEIFLQSLNLQANVDQIKNAQQSLGRSGSFFFFSHDNRFIIKTMTDIELDVLMNTFLQSYTSHLIKNPKSFLAQIYGAYTISICNVAPIHLILMENTLGSLEKYGGATQLYDLKGSTTKRFVKKQSSTSVVLKDQNFLESDDVFIELLSVDRQQLLYQLQCDTQFLNSIKIMDYSLLMGIVKENEKIQQLNGVHQNDRSKRAFLDVNGNMICLSIIDYLQLFDFSKRVEFRYKTIVKQNSKDLISCVLPDQYQARFMNFMKQIICSVIKEEQIE